MQPQGDDVVAKVGPVLAPGKGQDRREERPLRLGGVAGAQQIGHRNGELDGGDGGQQGRRRRPRQPHPADHEQHRQPEQRQEGAGVVAELCRYDESRQAQRPRHGEEDLFGAPVGSVRQPGKRQPMAATAVHLSSTPGCARYWARP